MTLLACLLLLSSARGKNTAALLVVSYLLRAHRQRRQPWFCVCVCVLMLRWADDVMGTSLFLLLVGGGAVVAVTACFGQLLEGYGCV